MATDKYFIIAGEPSGDLHAAHLAAQLLRRQPQAQVMYMGGDQMRGAIGHDPVIHCSQMAFMGFSEVLRNLGTVRRALSTIRQAIDTFQPQTVILVDYPSFNLKIAKHCHRRGIRVVWYISPKVWAWKKWRIKDLRKYVDQILCILPFETDFYASYGMAVDYVGNPTKEEVDAFVSHCPTRQEFYAKHGLRERRQIIALLPGSRRSELKNNLPVMLQAAAIFTQYQIVIAGAPGMPADYYHTLAEQVKARGHKIPDYKIVYDETFTLVRHAQAALVTSGTATLETALLGTPQVVCYRANGSALAYKIMKRILSVQYVSLPNLIADAPVVPEQLLHLCTPTLIADQLTPLLRTESAPRQAQLDGYALIRQRLGDNQAAPTAAQLIVDAAPLSEK